MAFKLPGGIKKLGFKRRDKALEVLEVFDMRERRIVELFLGFGGMLAGGAVAVSSWDRVSPDGGTTVTLAQAVELLRQSSPYFAALLVLAAAMYGLLCLVAGTAKTLPDSVEQYLSGAVKESVAKYELAGSAQAVAFVQIAKLGPYFLASAAFGYSFVVLMVLAFGKGDRFYWVTCLGAIGVVAFLIVYLALRSATISALAIAQAEARRKSERAGSN